MWSVACVVHYLLTSLSPFDDSQLDEDPAAIAQYQFPFWPRLYHRSFSNANGRYPGHVIMVRGVSSEANGFLRELMRQNPEARPSAEEALKHQWINPEGTDLMDVAIGGGNQALVNMLTKSSKEHRSDLYKLQLSAAGGHLEFVQRIVTGMAKPIMDVHGGEEGQTETALVGAAAGGYSEVVRTLLAVVCYPTRREGIHVFRAACRRALHGRHTRVVEQSWPLVLEYDFADIADNDVELMAAVAAFGTEAMLRAILPYAQPHIEAVIQGAARHGNTENLAMLLPSGHDGSHSLHNCALLEAANSGQRHIVKYLLDRRNIFPTVPLPPDTPADDIFSYALRNAATNGHLSIIQELFMRGIAPTHDAIEAAASHNHTSCFQFLVRTLRETYKWPPATVFSYITAAGILHCTLDLLKRSPEPAKVVKCMGDMARLGRVDVVTWLLRVVDNSRESVGIALKAAASAGQVEVLEVVLGVGRAMQSDILCALASAMAEDHLGTTERLMMELENGPYLRL